MTVRYEQLLQLVSDLPPAVASGERDVRWVSDAGILGLSRAADGTIEVFLRGDQLTPFSPVIREVLEYQAWYRAPGDVGMLANRLMLPAAGHFDQVAAFIVTELLRRGADVDLTAAFQDTEPIIELAIRRLRMSDAALLGLAGELLLLDALMGQASRGEIALVVGGWHGWRESLRDIQLEEVGVEVKTTTRETSTHQVQGVHQVDLLGRDDGGGSEELLFLVSVGLRWDDRDDAFSVPALVDSILRRLREAGRSDLAETFVAHVREYGAAGGVGYDHATMSGDRRFTRGFMPRFVRAYDMGDPAIEVLRSSDLAARHHVESHSVRFRVHLPDRVSGDVNPIWGLHEVAATLLAARA